FHVTAVPTCALPTSATRRTSCWPPATRRPATGVRCPRPAAAVPRGRNRSPGRPPGSLVGRCRRLRLAPAADLTERELREVVARGEHHAVLLRHVLAVGEAGQGEVGVAADGVGGRAADRAVAELLDAAAREGLDDASLVRLLLGLGRLGLGVE